MRRIVCLISGRGSNLEALLRAERAADWAGRYQARIAAVISDRASAAGLDLARAYGVDALAIEPDPAAAGAERADFEPRLAQALDRYTPALVVLAGFMRVLSGAFVAPLADRMINIHPSLLPAFAGLGTHRRVLDSGARVHGATVHFVTAAVDAGAIIAQAVVRVRRSDTEASLAQRVLDAEHRLLPRCVAWYLGGQVRLDRGRIDQAPGRVLAEGIDETELLELPA